MKKCPYCGKEYPDDVERCLIDDEPLSNGKTEVIQENEEAAEIAPPAIPPPRLKAIWKDREIRIFETILVCTIAFGASILYSALSSYNNYYAGVGVMAWLVQGVHEISAIGLLWYILMRHGKSFTDLGLTWAWKDVGWSVVLYLLGAIASYAVYGIFYALKLTSINQNTAVDYVGNHLFNGGIFFVPILFAILNPFFEELIARAYVITEVRRLTGSVTIAIIVSTALQVSYHFYQGAPLALAYGTLFLVFSIYYAKTNRITPVILGHLYADVGATLWYTLRQHAI